MREAAWNLVTGVLAVILCGVCLKIRQYVSKLDSLSQIWTFWLTDCLDKTWVSLHAILLRASWQWSCVKYVKIRQYVSKLDSLSQSWTICLLVFLTKDERACMQSCCGRLGSDLVWSTSQDQTVCLEVGQPVSKLDILAHWLSWETRLKTTLPALTSWHVPWFFHVHKPATVPDDFGRLRPLRFLTSSCVEEAHQAGVDLPTVCSFGDMSIWQLIVQLSYVCQGCLSWSWTYIVCSSDCPAMRLVLQSTAVGNRWPTMFCRICNILIYMKEPHILLTKY